MQQGGHAYTVGEVVIFTGSVGDFIFTQGFHQPEQTKIVSVDQPELADWNIEVFPNPATDRLTVRFSAERESALRVNVLDLLGRVILDASPLSEPTGSIIDCSLWQPGVYFLQLLDPQQAHATVRIVRLSFDRSIIPIFLFVNIPKLIPTMTRRHLLLLSLLMILIAWRAEAQFTPQGFNYQCIVRDGTGASMNNQTVTLLFTVRPGTSNGPVNYSEKQTVSTNEFGLVNLVIGQGSPLQGTFPAVNWGSGAKFLTVSVETAPNVFDELGSTQLMSVPYAIYAQNSANGQDNWGTQVVQTDPALKGDGTAANPLGIAQQGAQTGQVLKWDGAKWAPQNDISDTVQTGGTLTQINTGTGLTGGPITISGTDQPRQYCGSAGCLWRFCPDSSNYRGPNRSNHGCFYGDATTYHHRHNRRRWH